jgi:diguanylate cyclase (GGDEF)-like protein
VQDQKTELRVLAWVDHPPDWLAPDFKVHWSPEGGGLQGWDAAVFTMTAGESSVTPALRVRLQQFCAETAVLVLAPDLPQELSLALMEEGVQDVVDSFEPHHVQRAIRFAVARRHYQQLVRLSYATDLSTGLPHQEQLLEYVSQLIALRARDPAALVLIVLRIEESNRLSAVLGPEGSHILRRKLAVRLRAALRASDVVASIGSSMFGVLLGHVESASDGHTVVGKLMETLRQPLSVAGQSVEVAVAAGMAQWPEHGQDPQDLLQRAKSQALSMAAMGQREGYGYAFNGQPSMAANDDAAGS